MKNNFLNKILVIGIITLFFGASVMSSASEDVENANNIENISYFKNKGLRSNPMERINYFREIVLKLNRLEKSAVNPLWNTNGWSPTELVSSESVDNSTWCSIAIDSTGAIHVVWQDETDYGGSGSDKDIFYKMKPNGGEWTATEVVSSESSIISEYASLAVEPDGTVHVTWDEWNETISDVYYKMKPSGGDWTVAELIPVEGAYYPGLSSLAVEPDGTVHVAMNGLIGEDEEDIFYKMKPSGGDWTAAEVVTYDSTDNPYFASLAVDSDGNVHIAWHETNISSYILNIFYKMKPSGGDWTAAEAVTNSYTWSLYPSLAVDQDNNVHLTWSELSYYYYALADICYKTKPEGGVWSSTDFLTSNSLSMLSSISVGPYESVHVVFDEWGPGFFMSVFYRMKSGGGSWSTTEVVTNDFDGDAFFPSIDVDLSGVVHVAWEGWLMVYDEEDIYYKNGYVNLPPTAPTIDGQTSGKPGKEYEYTFNATDPDGDDVKYFINWGDNNTEWTGFSASGTEVMVKHTWDEDGTYNITAIAEDINGAQGPEGTLTVTMPRSRTVYHSLLIRLFERFPNLFPIILYLLSIQ